MPTSRGAPFPPPSSRGGILSLRCWERIPAFPSHLKRRRSPQHRREDPQGPATIPRVPQMPQSIPGKTVFPALLDFQAEDRLTPRWHVEQPCGKASWESLVGKPRGKAPDPLILANGSGTLLLQLGTKRTCIPRLETRTDSPGDSRSTPRSMSALYRNPQVRHRLHTRS